MSKVRVTDKRRFDRTGKAKQPSIPKRNRKERYAAEIYRLTKFVRPLDPAVDEAASEAVPKLAELGEPHNIEGKIGQYIILSVPETCSEDSAASLRDQAMTLLKRPVIVVTHNVMFMQAVRLPPKEAAEVVREAEDYAEARASAVQEAAVEPVAETAEPK